MQTLTQPSIPEPATSLTADPQLDLNDETPGRLRLVQGSHSAINVSGSSVDPAGVEEALNRHPSVDRAAVIAVTDTETGEAVKAFIALTEDGSAEQILSWMRDPATGMARHRIPKYIEFRRSLPVEEDPQGAADPQTYKQSETEKQ